jgi:hypothetical protein
LKGDFIMAGISSEGIKLSYKVGAGEYITLPNIQEVPDLSNGERETIEVTTLADSERKYIAGLYAGSEGLEFKSLYEKAEFTTLNAIADEVDWKIEFPDELAVTFKGTVSVRLDGTSVGSALTYTLVIIPTSKLTFA